MDKNVEAKNMVSIITSVYNGEQYIDEMIDSVIAQTYIDWELILFEDGSSDFTLRHVEAYKDSRIRLYINEHNEGLTKNLNKALRYAKGEYIVRIDGDDVMLPERLSRQVEFMDTHPEVGLAGCWAKSFGQREEVICKNESNDRIRIDLLFDTAIIHPSFIMRKKTIDYYHIIYDETLRYAQDYEIEYNFSKYSNVANIPEVLIKYRVHNSQISNEKKELQIECANKIRTRILKDLGLNMSVNEETIWLRFCNMIPGEKKDIHILKETAKKIIEVNEEKKIWNKDLLIKSIRYRILRYMSIHNFDEKELFHNYSVISEKWMNDCNIKKVAIYGAGYVGRRLCKILQQCGCEVICYLDRNAENGIACDGLAAVSINNGTVNADAVIVTPFEDFNIIKLVIEKRLGKICLSVEELL